MKHIHTFESFLNEASSFDKLAKELEKMDLACTIYQFKPNDKIDIELGSGYSDEDLEAAEEAIEKAGLTLDDVSIAGTVSFGPRKPHKKKDIG
jgi:hypothetical protein